MHDAYMDAIANNRPMRVLRATIMNGEERWIDHWIQPFYDAAGVTQGVICGWLDVTEQQRLIVELERVVTELEGARRLAEQASREKSNFLATMSHEIRTPLSAVIGTLELVQHQAEKGVFDQQGIQVAYASATALLDLIGDVLDISKIESGQLVFTNERLNFKALLESVASTFNGLALEKGLTLLLEFNEPAKLDVLSDALRLRQMLFNLVSNAIKFTEVGHVKISAIGKRVGSSSMHMRITVSDTGIGIPKSEQQRLFLPFSQLRHTTDSSGSGLGLYITRSLCKLMGGTLSIRSKPNTGTSMVISLTVPLLQSQSSTTQLIVANSVMAPHTPMPSLHVLVVEDYALHRQLLCQQLELLGHRFAVASTGQQALALWRSTNFDVIITDYRMPGMSGVELTATIRYEEVLKRRSTCLILGLTADAQPEEIQRGLEAGMNDCSVKPLGLMALQNKLASLSQQSVRLTEHRHSGVADDVIDHDFTLLLSLTGENREKAWRLAREILNAIEEAKQQVQAFLAHHLSGVDMTELAHQLLGVARMLNHQRLAEACKQVEQICGSYRADDDRGQAAVLALSSLLDEMSIRYRQLFAVEPYA